jgi:hypothetical protein
MNSEQLISLLHLCGCRAQVGPCRRVALALLRLRSSGRAKLAMFHDACPTYRRKELEMRILNIVTSPRGERSASIAIVDSFLCEYKKKIKGLVVDTLDVWSESLPEFDAEAIGAKYKGVSGEPMTPLERVTWEKI